MKFLNSVAEKAFIINITGKVVQADLVHTLIFRSSVFGSVETSQIASASNNWKGCKGRVLCIYCYTFGVFYWME